MTITQQENNRLLGWGGPITLCPQDTVAFKVILSRLRKYGSNPVFGDDGGQPARSYSKTADNTGARWVALTICRVVRAER